MATDTFYVGGSYDDAREYGDGTFDYTSTYINIYSYDDPEVSNYKCGGFRFRTVTIPQGSTILAAKFSGYVHSSYQNPNLNIYGNNVDNANDFNAEQDVIGRARTDGTGVTGDGYVSWVADGVGSGWQDKTGLENIVQEIVNRGSWSSDNALVLLFIANTDVNKFLVFYSYDKGSEYAAKLEVTWEVGGATYTKTFTTDGILKGTLTKTFTSDAILQDTFTKAFTADAILQLIGTKTFTADALLKAALTKTFDADAILKATLIKTFTVDAILAAAAAEYTKTFTVDAILKLIGTKTFSADALLTYVKTKTFTADAILHGTLTKTFTVDAIIGYVLPPPEAAPTFGQPVPTPEFPIYLMQLIRDYLESEVS